MPQRFYNNRFALLHESPPLQSNTSTSVNKWGEKRPKMMLGPGYHILCTCKKKIRCRLRKDIVSRNNSIAQREKHARFFWAKASKKKPRPRLSTEGKNILYVFFIMTSSVSSNIECAGVARVENRHTHMRAYFDVRIFLLFFVFHPPAQIMHHMRLCAGERNAASKSGPE